MFSARNFILTCRFCLNPLVFVFGRRSAQITARIGSRVAMDLWSWPYPCKFNYSTGSLQIEAAQWQRPILLEVVTPEMKSDPKKKQNRFAYKIMSSYSEN